MYELIKKNASKNSALTEKVVSSLSRIDEYGVTPKVLAKFNISGVKNFIGQVLSHANYKANETELISISQAIHSIVKS